MIRFSDFWHRSEEEIMAHCPKCGRPVSFRKPFPLYPTFICPACEAEIEWVKWTVVPILAISCALPTVLMVERYSVIAGIGRLLMAAGLLSTEPVSGLTRVMVRVLDLGITGCILVLVGMKLFGRLRPLPRPSFKMFTS
jgi:hypothetical protein